MNITNRYFIAIISLWSLLQSHPIYAENQNETTHSLQKIYLDKEYDFSSDFLSLSEDESEQFAQNCDGDTRKSLIAILADKESDNDFNKSKLAYYLGKTCNSDVYPALVTCIERWQKEQFTHKVKEDMKGAMIGMGFLSTKESLAYLHKMATPEYWGNLSISVTSTSDSTDNNERLKFIKQMRKYSVHCISYSGTKLAQIELDSMENEPHLDDIKNVIFSAKGENEMRMRSEHLNERGKYAPAFK